MEEKTTEEWRSHIAPALQCKLSEFKMIGYEAATEEEIWKCLQEKVWKGTPKKRLHEIVQDIFHLPASVYMNFMTLRALQSEEDDLMASIKALSQPKDE